MGAIFLAKVAAMLSNVAAMLYNKNHVPLTFCLVRLGCNNILFILDTSPGGASVRPVPKHFVFQFLGLGLVINFFVTSSSFFGLGHFHVLGLVIFMFWVWSSSFLDQVIFVFGLGRVLFSGWVIFVFWGRSSFFLGQVIFIFLGWVVFIFLGQVMFIFAQLITLN